MLPGLLVLATAEITSSRPSFAHHSKTREQLLPLLALKGGSHSRHVPTLLALRGGSQPEGLADFTPHAIAFFNNHRVPAALLAATAIKDAFVLQGRREECGGVASTTRTWRTIRYAYLILMITSFGMEISVIFMSTHVGVQLGAGRAYSAFGTSLVDMLTREFEFEYVSVRCQFITGVFTFVAAQALRVRYSLRRYRDLSFCAMFCLFSVAASMLAYNNANTITFGGYAGLLARWLKLSMRFYAERCRFQHPMAILAATTFVLAVGFFARAVANSAQHIAIELSKPVVVEEDEDDIV